MSVVDPHDTRVELDRSGPDAFWQRVREHYAGEDVRRWKYLAMLALRETAEWPLDMIGAAFGHNKGHVTRCLARIKSDIRERFQPRSTHRTRPNAPPGGFNNPRRG